MLLMRNKWIAGLQNARMENAVGVVWSTTHMTELCLQLTVSSRPCKQRWAPTL